MSVSMAKRKRPSISISGLTYQRLRKYCQAEGLTVTAFAAEIVLKRLGFQTEENKRIVAEKIQLRSQGARTYSPPSTTSSKNPNDPEEFKDYIDPHTMW